MASFHFFSETTQMTNAKPKHDIHEALTNQIIELLDRVDMNEYEPPFSAFVHQGIPKNPTTNHQYQGVNILALWFNQHSNKYTSNHWATFKQWKEQGANVRKGEKGSRIIFYKTLIKEGENDQGDTEEYKIPMLRLFTVFNANQVENYEDPDAVQLPELDRVEKHLLIEEFCRSTEAEIKSESPEAYYHRKEDYINMPETSQFNHSEQISASEHYYSTLLHELTHWTGAHTRLNRPGISGEVKKEDYAFEELVAELGAAFLCAQHGIHQTKRENHAIYIKSWLNALREDKSLIFKAAAQASKASQYLNELQLEPVL